MAILYPNSGLSPQEDDCISLENVLTSLFLGKRKAFTNCFAFVTGESKLFNRTAESWSTTPIKLLDLISFSIKSKDINWSSCVQEIHLSL